MSESLDNKRPLSPHLQVYKPQLTSMTSIMHRITGFALFVGCFMLTCWLLAISSSGSHFHDFQKFITSGFGKFLMAGWTFALVYHLLNGIRHLIWDTGKNLSIQGAYRTGWAVIIGSVLVTVVILMKAYS